MRHGGLFLRAACLLMLGGAAEAATLSCDQYRTRLNDALSAASSKNGPIKDFTVGFTSPTRGKRYDWVGAGVSGTMSCGADDEFEEFVISLNFPNKDQVAELLDRLIVIAGGSICALTADAPTACAEVSRVMLKDGLEQVGRAFSRGSRAPSGLSKRDVVKGVHAEMTVASTLMTFLIGPGRGSSMDDTRQMIAVAPPAKPAP